MARIGVFTVGDAQKVAEATRRTLSGPRTMLNVPYRPAIRQGGGACSCITVHELICVGVPTGGTIVLNVGVDDGTSVTTESITLDFNESSSGAKTAFEAHTKIASTDIAVKGGDFPLGALYIVYLSSGTLNRDQPIPTTNTNSLTGGTSPHLEFRIVTSADWEA